MHWLASLWIDSDPVRFRPTAAHATTHHAIARTVWLGSLRMPRFSNVQRSSKWACGCLDGVANMLNRPPLGVSNGRSGRLLTCSWLLERLNTTNTFTINGSLLLKDSCPFTTALLRVCIGLSDTVLRGVGNVLIVTRWSLWAGHSSSANNLVLVRCCAIRYTLSFGAECFWLAHAVLLAKGPPWLCLMHRPIVLNNLSSDGNLR